MSLRNSILLIAALSVSACGFEPMYGSAAQSKTATSQALAGVRVDEIGGRSGQILRAHLEDTLNPTGDMTNPQYRLSATLKHTNIPVSIATDGTVSRYNVHFLSQYVLYKNGVEKPITSGMLNYTTSFNNLVNSYYSTYIAQKDAIKRGTQALGDLYFQRLAIYLDKGAPIADEITMPDPDRPASPDLLLQQRQGDSVVPQ